ncbi:MAG: family peptidase [Anaerocolumna sp.]|nr:family peptidase [Anaerocolumna sp.]
MDNARKMCYNTCYRLNSQIINPARRCHKLLKEVNFEVEKEKFTVKVVYSARKTISLELKADGTITARVPNRIPDYEVKQLINENKFKLYNKYKEFCDYKEKEGGVTAKAGYDEIYQDGATLPFVLGELTLQIINRGGRDFINLHYHKLPDGKRILALETQTEDKAVIREYIADWYRRYAKDTLEMKASYYAKRMHTDYGRITVREQKTRWGSCSSKGNLNFNWKLMMMPEPIIDYVVIHELAHRKHMDHSKNFWFEVEKVLPDYKIKRDWLKKNGRLYTCY